MVLVAISLPGDLLVDDFDKLFELDITDGSDSLMFGGTAVVQRGHIIDKALMGKYGFRDIVVKVIK